MSGFKSETLSDQNLKNKRKASLVLENDKDNNLSKHISASTGRKEKYEICQ